jgi:hypothetical protein
MPPLPPDATRQLLAKIVTGYYAAVGATVALRAAEAERAGAELARLMDEARRFLWPPIAWRDLLSKVRNAQGGVAGDKEAREMLLALKDKGQRPWYGWYAPLGLPHEDPSRMESWGPRSREDVDWSGF